MLRQTCSFFVIFVAYGEREFVKKQFQKVFKENDYGIFDKFWGNSYYGEKLGWGLIDEETAFSKFKKLVEDLDENLYDFIKLL